MLWLVGACPSEVFSNVSQRGETMACFIQDRTAGAGLAKDAGTDCPDEYSAARAVARVTGVRQSLRREAGDSVRHQKPASGGTHEGMEAERSATADRHRRGRGNPDNISDARTARGERSAFKTEKGGSSHEKPNRSSVDQRAGIIQRPARGRGPADLCAAIG